MKTIIFLFSTVLILSSLNSCKKGCTNPYAINYKPKKTIDKGNCEVYARVTLNSIQVNSIPEYDKSGVLWDNSGENDLDMDNSHPDLAITYRAEEGYSFDPNEYYPTVDPHNVNWLQTLTVPVSLNNWQNDNGFFVYFYEVDNDGLDFTFMDSVKIDPFDFDSKNNRFKDTLDVTSKGYKFTAHMKWDK
jgi:hypothetical protein